MLTTLLTIKSRLGLDAFDTTDEVILTNILKHVSARFAAECHRTFDYGTGLKYEFRADQINILIDHPPIVSISAFELKTTESEGWLLQSSIDYLLSPQKAIIELSEPLGTSTQLGRVTYPAASSCLGARPSRALPLCPTISNKPASSK